MMETHTCSPGPAKRSKGQANVAVDEQRHRERDERLPRQADDTTQSDTCLIGGRFARGANTRRRPHKQANWPNRQDKQRQARSRFFSAAQGSKSLRWWWSAAAAPDEEKEKIKKTKKKNNNNKKSSLQRHRGRRNGRHTIPLMSALTLCAPLLVLALQLATLTSPIQAFNVDTQFAVVHSGPPGSYFGYTVAQHRDRSVNWLLVGSPKAQTDQPRTKESGAVYRCTPNLSKACQQIAFDPTGSSVFSARDQQTQSDDKSHQFFGASLASSSDNGSIIACASRYVYFSTNLKRRDPVGTCWLSRGSFSGFLEYSPCRLNEQWGHHHLGSCQAGFSSAITKDGGKIFMGAPGSHVWQGQVFAHNLRTDLTNSTSWENPHSEDDSYLGYSLSTGRFSAPQTNEPAASGSDLAIGIPRANDLAGKVMIVDRELRTLRNISGEQLGAYFGYSLATIDVNGDGLDDLAIGAPLFYNETYKGDHFDRGRVYIVQQTARHEFQIVQRIDGHRNRARFGTALANCGDLNKDTYQDLAVGAPYDGPEGHGAVYIYMGGRRRASGQLLGLNDEFDQVIFAEQVRGEGANLRSFGFSLSGGLDQDNNQYPDLLVGDYEADRAILLKARPVVNVTSSIQFQPDNFNLDDKNCLLPNTNQTVSCLTVQYCTKYTGINVDSRLGFVHDIKLDTENKGAPRLFFLHNEAKNEERNSSMLTKDVNQCKSFKAYLTKQIRDKLTPLKIDIDYNLADQADTYDYTTAQPKLKPVLNRLPGVNGNKMSRTATIQKNCGYDNVCVPDLKLIVEPNIDQYTIGSNEKLVLDVTVGNNGEDAFESMFYLTMPMTINYITINKTRSDYPVCSGAKPDQTGVNILTCDLGNPQQRNDVVKFSVITEPARGQYTSPDFTFVAQVNSTNPEQDDRHREDNQVAIGIPIRVEVQLVLSGNSQPVSVEHNFTYHKQQQVDLNGVASSRPNRQSEADVGPEIYHIYQLHNRGPSTINDIAVTILWPTKRGDDYLLYLVDDPITSDKVKCKPSPADAVNPLNLKYLPGNLKATSKLTTTITNSNQYSQTNNRTSVSAFRLNKRQATSSSQQQDDLAQSSQPQAMAQTTTTVDNSVIQQMSLSTCGPNQCTQFECNVNDLGNSEIATIKIRSRLFEETINKLSIQEYGISSKLVAQIKALPYNVSTATMPPYVHKVETQVHTTGMSVQDLLPWWLIILAILLGIGLFILLACFLKYLGFFARKRPPKGPEREPLTPTMWNDYHYSPGDTAL